MYTSRYLLDDYLKQFTTINTHKGLFQYQKLPFGISTAPTLFQCTMESILLIICVHINTILVAGVGEQDHFHNLGQTLELDQVDRKITIEPTICTTDNQPK